MHEITDAELVALRELVHNHLDAINADATAWVKRQRGRQGRFDLVMMAAKIEVDSGGTSSSTRNVDPNEFASLAGAHWRTSVTNDGQGIPIEAVAAFVSTFSAMAEAGLVDSLGGSESQRAWALVSRTFTATIDKRDEARRLLDQVLGRAFFLSHDYLDGDPDYVPEPQREPGSVMPHPSGLYVVEGL